MFSLEAYKALIDSIADTFDNNFIELKANTIHMDYSGRFMYGAECLGVVASCAELDRWTIDMAEALSVGIQHTNDEDTRTLLGNMKAALKTASYDSMGLSTIKYFKTITIPKEYHDDLKAVLVDYIH